MNEIDRIYMFLPQKWRVVVLIIIMLSFILFLSIELYPELLSNLAMINLINNNSAGLSQSSSDSMTMQAIKINSETDHRLGYVAIIYLSQAKNDLAWGITSRLIQASPNIDRDMALLVIAKKYLSINDKSHFELIIKNISANISQWFLGEAKTQELKNDLANCEYLLRLGIEHSPEDIDLHKQLATFLQNYRNDIPAVVHEYEEIVKLEPDITNMLALARSYNLAGNPGLSIQLLKNIKPKSQQEEIDVDIQLSDFLMSDQQYPEAMNLLEKLNIISPDSEPVLRRLANGYQLLGQKDQAWEYAQKAIAIAPKSLYSYWTASDILYAQKRYTESESYLLKMLALTPPGDQMEVRGLLRLGDIYSRSGNITKALSFYCRASNLNHWVEFTKILSDNIKPLGNCTN